MFDSTNDQGNLLGPRPATWHLARTSAGSDVPTFGHGDPLTLRAASLLVDLSPIGWRIRQARAAARWRARSGD